MPEVRRRKVLEARVPASDGRQTLKVTAVDGRDRRVRGVFDSAGGARRVDGIARAARSP